MTFLPMLLFLDNGPPNTKTGVIGAGAGAGASSAERSSCYS